MSARVAIVFGGSRGIGGAIASRLARDGFDVALTYVSRPDRASDLVSAIEDIGRRAIAVRADSADPVAIRNAVAETVERLGTLDVAVVNAGVLRRALVEVFTLEDLDLMLDVNVRGVFLAIQASVARMHDGGRVVTLARLPSRAWLSLMGLISFGSVWALIAVLPLPVSFPGSSSVHRYDLFGRASHPQSARLNAPAACRHPNRPPRSYRLQPRLAAAQTSRRFARGLSGAEETLAPEMAS